MDIAAMVYITKNVLDNTKFDSDNYMTYYLKVILANKKIEIEYKYLRGFIGCKKYLAKFDKPDFIVNASEAEILNRFKQMTGKETLSEVKNIELGDIESIIIYQKIAERLLENNIMLVHGAAVSVNQQCYVFMAPSGTGKTTHILNWKKMIPETKIVNGDKPLIDLDNMLVYGTPWSGKEGMNCNICVPLAGIIDLERSENNCLKKTNFREMIPVLLQQCYIPNDIILHNKAINLLGRFSSVPCFKMYCNMEEESAVIAYKGLCS